MSVDDVAAVDTDSIGGQNDHQGANVRRCGTPSVAASGHQPSPSTSSNGRRSAASTRHRLVRRPPPTAPSPSSGNADEGTNRATCVCGGAVDIHQAVVLQARTFSKTTTGADMHPAMLASLPVQTEPIAETRPEMTVWWVVDSAQPAWVNDPAGWSRDHRRRLQIDTLGPPTRVNKLR